MENFTGKSIPAASLPLLYDCYLKLTQKSQPYGTLIKMPAKSHIFLPTK